MAKETANRPGLFVTLEGVEGAGKTTHAAFIAQWLRDHGREAVLTREPGGTKLGNEVRQILLHGGGGLPITDRSELLLIFAARQQHIDEVIRPSLERGQVVICDRFTDSTYAYQGGGRGIAKQDIAAVEAWVQCGLKPHLTFLFDLDPGQGLRRTHSRRPPGSDDRKDRFEGQNDEFFARVRRTFLDIAKQEPARVHLIDADRPLADIQKELAAEMQQVIGK